MKIKTKLESVNKIKELKLNIFPEELFEKGQENKVETFINKYNVDYYTVRSKGVTSYKGKIGITKEEVKNEIKKHNLFTVAVSSYNYIDNLLLSGDIKIDRNNGVWLWASKTIYPKFLDQNPEYNLCTDVFDRKLNDILGFDIIYKYIINNSLIDVIVEFAVFDKPLGINNEQIVVFEIRTNY